MSARRRRARSRGLAGPATRRRRLTLLALGAVVAYALLIGRAVQLQALDSDWLQARADRQHHSTLRLGPLRGEIVDRAGRLLATSATVESVAASPRRMAAALNGDRDRAVARIARVLELDAPDLSRRLAPRRGFVWLKRWVSPDQADRVRALDIPGLTLHPERKRFYPSRDLAASYIGFAGHDGAGLAGVELAFDGVLRGTAASLEGVRDARGAVLAGWSGDTRARTGATVVLTLDARLQHAAERALDDALEHTGARHAMLVAIDPRNGDLLAVAERPSFDPNQFWLENPSSFRPRAFVSPFEPGSTLKPFVVAVALDSGEVQPDDRFDCEGGEWMVGDRVIRDSRPHGRLTVADIVRVSSNIGAGKIAARIGSTRLVEGLRRFGFGARTGSGFPGETPGLLHSLREAQPVERANLAFGQGIAVSALQLVSAGATIANGGLRVRPRLVLRVERDGHRIDAPAELGGVGDRVGLGERVVSAETADRMLRMMRAAVESGTGRAARLPHHAVAGKTGTAQKAVNGTYSDERFVASFLGIAPADDPQLVIAVVLDEPRGVRAGGATAAPVFRRVAGFALGHMGSRAEGAE